MNILCHYHHSEEMTTAAKWISLLRMCGVPSSMSRRLAYHRLVFPALCYVHTPPPSTVIKMSYKWSMRNSYKGFENFARGKWNSEFWTDKGANFSLSWSRWKVHKRLSMWLYKGTETQTLEYQNRNLYCLHSDWKLKNVDCSAARKTTGNFKSLRRAWLLFSHLWFSQWD